MAKIHPSSEARRPTTPSTPVYAFVDGVTGETRWSTTVPKLVMATDSEMADLQKSFPHCLSSPDRVRVVNSGELTCMDSYVSNIEELADLAEDVPMLPDDFTEGELLEYETLIGGYLSATIFPASSPKRSAVASPVNTKCPPRVSDSGITAIRPVTPPKPKQMYGDDHRYGMDHVFELKDAKVLPLHTPVREKRKPLNTFESLSFSEPAAGLPSRLHSSVGAIQTARLKQIARRILQNTGVAL